MILMVHAMSGFGCEASFGAIVTSLDTRNVLAMKRVSQAE